MAVGMGREMFPEKFEDRVRIVEVYYPKSGVRETFLGDDFPDGEPLYRSPENTFAMISPEEFDKRNEEAQRAAMPAELMGHPVQTVERLTDNPNPLGRMATPEESEEMAREIVGSAAQSPITRLLAAVRDVLKYDPPDGMLTEFMELREAYDALNLDD